MGKAFPKQPNDFCRFSYNAQSIFILDIQPLHIDLIWSPELFSSGFLVLKNMSTFIIDFLYNADFYCIEQKAKKSFIFVPQLK